ncbi:MAG TPA: DUF4199 domain-containing protein [Flavobacteriaceae bacterium]|jgi:hypothetical protein|nr:DUF4199 domain-containing protein [Flavobacteriaceae bacterium]MAM27922.1 DUF4199 domain-containing protein [Flavobacteriaceae bacterium]MAY53449.1 DUF4199 domain-containing protein [Flavobacteriaceae bacterium]HBR54209.1 DUF4199 domain-containing protein [Flavobacteriaceae bacterium]HIB49028.1 DUF4199 domain-containing protein [Flavobacteriaceae bacterium]|tara:strand:+ start:348 stop:824 length:477 start_codon:yes stop_codon:yes gene_type:complete
MKAIKIELKWAFIFTITMLVWMLFEKTLGWHDEKIADHFWLTFLFVPFAILMYVLVMREKRRRQFDKKMTWLQGFVTGLKMAIFVALLSPLAQYITHNYITPEYFNNVVTYSVTNDLMSIKEANDYFNINNYIWQSALGALGGGLIISAIVAIFMKRS